MKHIRTITIAAAAALSLGIAAYAAPVQADAVSAATQQAAPDVDKILDRLDAAVQKLEKLAADNGGSLKDVTIPDKLQAEINAVGEELVTISNAQLTPAQEQRATDLLGRLYGVMAE